MAGRSERHGGQEGIAQVRSVKRADGSAAADRCRLDRRSLRRDGEQRHHAFVREIHVLERMVLVLERGAGLEVDDVQVPRTS